MQSQQQSIMQAVRIPTAPPGTAAFTAANPAPPSSLQITTIPRPTTSQPGQLLIQVKATTIIRDNLTWPELYADPPAQPGNDFAGIVISTHDAATSPFKPGDEVYGMLSAHRGGAWAEYAIATDDEASLKPRRLSWAEAAALPLSALTADQALFEQAGLSVAAGQDGKKKKRVLVTGAAGGVGMCLVQLALAAGHSVVAATSSRARTAAFLAGLGVLAAPEYDEVAGLPGFDAVIDTVGGDVLRRSWGWVADGGVIVSVDSGSWDFVEEHKRQGYDSGKETVRAVFFIVEPSRKSMARVSDVVERRGLKAFVSQVLPLHEAGTGYELCQSGQAGRGKIVLTP